MDVTEEAREAVAGFIRLIADPEQRQAFVVDPERTLRENSIARDDFPDGVFDVVSTMSFGELSTVAQLNQRLVAAGMERPEEPGGVACIL
jgi:hypothetical protein